MTITLPHHLVEVIEILGVNWPEADEDKIFECSRAWKDYAGEVEHVIADAERACREAIERNRGESITAFEGHWRELGGQGDLRRAADAAGIVSNALELFGGAVIAMKTATIAQLTITAGAVVASVASAIFTAGLSTVAGGAAVQAGRVAIRKIIEELIEKLVKNIIPKLKHEAGEIFENIIKRLRHYLDETVTRLSRMLDRKVDPVSNIHNADDILASGARMRPRDLLDDIAQRKWAKDAYEDFLKDDRDIEAIAGNLRDFKRTDGSGFTHQDVSEIKDHLFRKEHPIQNYETGKIEMRRFDPDEEIADAWIRLRSGNSLPEDRVLLEHELAESRYMRENPSADYREAHQHANQHHNWESQVPLNKRQDIDSRW